MDRALRSLNQRAAKKIIIRRGTSCDVIPMAEIMYCEVQGRKIYIHQSSGKIVDYYDKLENLAQSGNRNVAALRQQDLSGSAAKDIVQIHKIAPVTL